MYTLTVIAGLYLSCVCFVASAPPFGTKKKNCNKEDLYAVCNLVANPNRPSQIEGKLFFMQPVTSDCRYDFLSIQVNINNIPKYNHTSRHGIHVHQYGDMINGCESMGGHYNPHGNTHGSPWHPFNSRHVGDLGNFKRRDRTRGPFGLIKKRHVDYMASLYGTESIIGRGIVLHAKEDDLGLNPKDPESLKTGNAGARLACCVIGRSDIIDQSKFNLYR